MEYKGTYSDIFEALKAYPNGADKDDFIIISGKIHVWNKRRGTWVTDSVEIPDQDQKPGITLFVDLTEEGVLTDYLGRKWQLPAYNAGLTVPTITITDITTDADKGGYSPSEYPLLPFNATGAVKLIAIAATAGTTIEYKVVNDEGQGDEAWTTYSKPIVLKSEGTYIVKARATNGSQYSDTVTSEEFTVTALDLKSVWEEISAATLTYASGNIDAAGGSKTAPTLVVKQYKKTYNTAGNTNRVGTVVTPTSVTYSTDASYLTIADDGSLICQPTTVGTTRTANITAAITVNGKSTTATASVTQNAGTITLSPSSATGVSSSETSGSFNVTITGNLTINSVTAGTGVKSASYSSGKVTYIVEENTTTSVANKKITLSTSIGDIVFAISQNATTIVPKYGISRVSGTAAPTTEALIVTPIDAYTVHGDITFTNNVAQIDCSGTDTRFKMAFFAVPKANSLKIEGVSSGDNLTDQYTVSVIGNYKLYALTDSTAWTQDTIKLTLS